MRVLLDECLPRGLAGELTGHQVVTVSQAGWTGMRNGESLLPLVPGILRILESAPCGQRVRVEA